MDQSVPLRQSVSPRFDNIMTRSNGLPWFPEPLNKSQHNISSVDPTSARSISLKSPSARSNNNDTHTKGADSTFTSNGSSDAMIGARFDKEKDIYTCIYIWDWPVWPEAPIYFSSHSFCLRPKRIIFLPDIVLIKS